MPLRGAAHQTGVGFARGDTETAPSRNWSWLAGPEWMPPRARARLSLALRVPDSGSPPRTRRARALTGFKVQLSRSGASPARSSTVCHICSCRSAHTCRGMHALDACARSTRAVASSLALLVALQEPYLASPHAPAKRRPRRSATGAPHLHSAVTPAAGVTGRAASWPRAPYYRRAIGEPSRTGAPTRP